MLKSLSKVCHICQKSAKMAEIGTLDFGRKMTICGRKSAKLTFFSIFVVFNPFGTVIVYLLLEGALNNIVTARNNE